VFSLCVVYYESRKREVKIRLMNEGRCDERQQVRVEKSTRLSVEVEEIGIYASPPPPPTDTHKKTGEWARKTRVSTRKQGYKQDNIDKI
jgi:hypothetical protein